MVLVDIFIWRERRRRLGYGMRICGCQGGVAYISRRIKKRRRGVERGDRRRKKDNREE